MTVKKLKNLEKVVEEILKTSPYARDNDCYLYASVIRRCNPYVLYRTVGEFFTTNHLFDVPNIKSVERARRKVQEKHPELASERAKKKRAEEQQAYIEYARQEAE